jgi:hypothetical protein
VVLLMLLRRVPHPAQYVLSAFSWLFRACVVILIALGVTPSAASASSIWTNMSSLALSLVIFGGIVILLASLARVVDLRQILG